MLKFLNQQYLRKKSRYPDEDRYKSKSFYKFLGRTNPNVHIGSLSQNDPEVPDLATTRNGERTESDIEELQSVDYESDDSIANIRHRSVYIDDSDENDSSHRRDSESSEISLIDINELQRYKLEDANSVFTKINKNDNGGNSQKEREDEDGAMVHVGGRVRRGKNILHGVLPESAKRLSIWKGKKLTTKTKRVGATDLRKGLAIKKKGSSISKTNFINEMNLYDELFQEKDSDEVNMQEIGEHYLTFNNDDLNKYMNEALNESHAFDFRYNSYMFSESESDEEENEPTILFANKGHLDSSEEPEISHDISLSDIDMFDGAAFPNKVGSAPQKRISDYLKDESEINPDIVKQPKRASTFRGVPWNKQQNSRGTDPVLKRKYQKFGVKRLRRKEFNAPSRKLHEKPTKAKEQEEAKGSSTKTKNSQSEVYQPPISNYYYKKSPATFTTSIEVESTKKFIKTSRFDQIHQRDFQFNRRKERLVDIDISKLHLLSQDYISFGSARPLTVNLGDRGFTLSLVTKLNSINEAVQLLQSISRRLNGTIVDLSGIAGALRTLLNWYVTLQEIPNEVEWKYLRYIVKRSARRDPKEVSELLPSTLCIFYTFLNLTEKYNGSSKVLFDEFKDYCGFFWWLVYEKLHENTEFGTFNEADMYYSFILELLSSNMELFWSTVINSVEKVNEQRTGMCLEGMFYLCNKISPKNYNWECLYKLYDTFNEQIPSTLYKEFIDICFLLNQRRSWPLEEKLIMLLYSTVTKRKFFNFEDESLDAAPISKISTINDIPNSSFFECFIQFFYYYVSALSADSSTKRLSTKLLTSSHFSYGKGKKHQVAFINRFNFIIILSQVSSLNQNNSVTDLIKSIQESKDLDIYSLAIRNLKTYTEIVISKDQTAPIESFSLLLVNTSSLYSSVPGISKILIQLSVCMKQSFCLDKPSSSLNASNSLQFFNVMRGIELKDFHDDIAIRVIELLKVAAHSLILERETLIQKSELAKSLVEKIRSYISRIMGGFPMKTRVREQKLTLLIEDCLQLWISISAIVDPNWNKIIFQEFLYMGNSYSRDLFSLELFCNILNYNDIPQHLEVVLQTLIKSLAKLQPPKYATSIINALRRLSLPILEFKNIHLNRRLTPIELNTNKSQIVLSVLSNLVEGAMSRQSKVNLICSFMDALNEEYDRYFKSSKFVEFCKRNVEFLQVHATELVGTLSIYQELANKLDVTPISANQIKWKGLPLVKKLVVLHKEFISSIVYQKDVFATLNQYTETGIWNSLFHLVSIYMKAITINQLEYWLCISILLDFLSLKLDSFEIDVTSREFARFVLSLEDMTSLCYSHWGSRFANVLRNYQLKALCQTYSILGKAYLIFDGYKDHQFIKKAIEKSLLDYALPSAQKMPVLDKAYSSFLFSDISNNSKDLLLPMEQHLLKPDHERYDPQEYAGHLRVLAADNALSETLYFDFSFQ
ncbi:hypothetical protein PSN45_004461 [Yamadazyma tenuis]|uniref:uncharacterized protein n=1 Tax=Candida tenuis TaxID=2315449 RepID=UPI00279AC046|nr:hypothetical protein PSN45_004461 [Yamadazyma tenuis]